MTENLDRFELDPLAWRVRGGLWRNRIPSRVPNAGREPAVKKTEGEHAGANPFERLAA